MAARIAHSELPRRQGGNDKRDADGRERLNQIVQTLEREAEKRISQRYNVERRWIEDYEQYWGRYDDKARQELNKSKNKSKLFINLTRKKTNAMEARLSDMLFPTDDKNWGIQPTPVPELNEEAEAASRAAAEMQQQVAGMNERAPEMGQAQEELMERQQHAAGLKARLDEAKRRAKAMEDEIEDDLRECRYQQQCRDVISDGCKLGTGIIKGPILDGSLQRSWSQREAEGAGADIYQLEIRKQRKPVFLRVDPWNFFPSMDARSIEESDGAYERHLMTKQQLRKLAKRPEFDPDAIRRVLQQEPREGSPQYLADLRQISDTHVDASMPRYHVWEYHGPIDDDDYRDLVSLAGDEEDMAGDLENIDPLQELWVSVWFCQGELLKFGPYPLDRCEPLYSVFNLEKDDACIFGYGIPFIMRDQQRALNSAWRMMMDNAAISVGPQIEINVSAIEPADGTWELLANKIWYAKQSASGKDAPFKAHHIPSNQGELMAIIEIARRFIDEETAMPMVAEGNERGSTPEQTATGMSILMNSANVVFRRVVKNWDDDMTTSNLRRLYDWHMQFSEKEHIKGDYEVDARGTSVLLVRELQSQNLMVALSQFSAHPVVGPILKVPELTRRLFQTMMLPAADVVMTDEEIMQAQAAAAEQPAPNPEMEKLAAQMNMQREEQEHERWVKSFERETELIKLAQQGNMSLETLRAKLASEKEERMSDERKFAAELAVTQRQGASGGGFFDDP